ncbi:Short-chain dehydrogenase/reductase SDR protein [Dioscorea alata]|uniref:Short-chain dehydrogenase/reductase SDR protein n=1 Tax=Dioscorea alata TaxID=55571 RepID=A0ACB7TU94_DIOAL|nr:Short-chain dehydrogenase/reductase SDR protein [Dioscorea alata]
MAALRMLLSYDFWRMAILWTLVLISSYFHLLLTARFPCILRWHHRTRSYPRCRFSSAPESIIKRPVCVVTGASSGLGAAAVRALASQGYHVVLVGRCLQLLQKTIGEIKQQDDDASLSAFEVDLSSFSSIKKFESGIKQWLLDSNLHPSIQLLINNAGILATSCRVTSDGYDQMMQTNFIGAFVLTNLLLPLLKISPVPSKIVNVTSFTHRCISNTDLNEGTLGGKIFDCLPTSGSYPSAHTYELSKFCLLLFSYELHRQLHLVDPSPNISVIAADPGVVETKIMREIPPIISELAFKALRIMRLLQSPETGVDSIIDAALAPSDASGEYFFGGRGRTIRSSKLSYNAQLGKNLWSRSMMLFEEVQSSFH